MKDITAILFHYDESTLLHKALHSLQSIDSRLKSIIVLHNQKLPSMTGDSKLDFVNVGNNDGGELLNRIVSGLTTTYVLLLHHSSYLFPTVHADELHLPSSKSILATIYYSRGVMFHYPVLVRTSFLKKDKLLPIRQLPFKEALLPAWLGNIDLSEQIIKEKLTKQSKINRSANRIQKEKIMQKYQLETIKTEKTTLSVIISTYNMEQYVETAVLSCLLQNEAFDQILIIDDGSTDNSYHKLKCLEDESQIKVLHKKNRGKAKALNALLPHVTSDYILEVDADDWLDADACSIIKKHLSNLPKEVAVLYGNLRKWKQTAHDVLYKNVAKGVPIKSTTELLSYPFPLGPRIYRTSTLIKENGFPVIAFEDGRLYEDVSVLNQLLKKHLFHYKDFTIYNVREHRASITKNNNSKWDDFLKILKSQ